VPATRVRPGQVFLATPTAPHSAVFVSCASWPPVGCLGGRVSRRRCCSHRTTRELGSAARRTTQLSSRHRALGDRSVVHGQQATPRLASAHLPTPTGRGGRGQLVLEPAALDPVTQPGITDARPDRSDEENLLVKTVISLSRQGNHDDPSSTPVTPGTPPRGHTGCRSTGGRPSRYRSDAPAAHRWLAVYRCRCEGAPFAACRESRVELAMPVLAGLCRDVSGKFVQCHAPSRRTGRVGGDSCVG